MRTVLLCLLMVGCRNSDKVSELPSDTGNVSTVVDADGDGYSTDEDCDDTTSVINPGAEEICDGIDNNCDGQIDEGVTSIFYADNDSDGFGDPDNTVEGCEVSDGFVATGTDCNDSSAESFPGAPEQCDGLDNDCDGDIDEEVRYDWYADADGDGYGDPDSAYDTCDPPPGYVTDNSDCDDTEADAYPGAEEVCDEVDNDCDASVDEDVTTTYYADTDGDGFGVTDKTTEACTRPTGYAQDTGDCNDADSTISPNATEVCDDIDNDCDGTTDTDAIDQNTYYADSDSDGFGDATNSTDACDTPSGYVTDDSDCNDADGNIHPDAVEVCDDADNDCDGDIDTDATDMETFYADNDGDGYGGSASTMACAQPSGFADNADDCDDGEKDANPGETEICDDIDNDCDGDTDEGLTSIWYRDADSDGYGTSDTTTEACEAPSGYVADDSDCDDTEADAYPGAEEVCDDIDNDCDEDTDEGTTTTFYVDADSDGYGNADVSQEACEAPTRFVDNADDCDDGEEDANPGETEICDDIDNDCDGDTDEGLTSIWYQDADSDGYGTSDTTTEACEAPSGYVADDSDCDDTEADAYPGAKEVCDDIDNDCDGDTDEGTRTTFYVDADSDGYGSTTSTEACTIPSGYADNDDDCDDGAEDTNPAAAELCDGVDNDCDEQADNGVLGAGEDCPAADCADVLLDQDSAADGVYWIAPDTTAFEAYCDQTGDDGGWTLLLSADGASTYWGNNSASWTSSSYDTTVPTSLTDADFHSQAYGDLVTEEIRICYGDDESCYVFEHSMTLALLDFFVDGETFTAYSSDSYDISDAGSSSIVSDYESALGLSSHSVSCQWLGINNVNATSAIGLMGDWNCGCASYVSSNPGCFTSGYLHHDDLAVGVGLQSCYDANSCSSGGSGHSAGQTRGVNGTDDSGVYGPWFVFGR